MWMVPLFERYVLTVYAATHDTNRPVTARIRPSGYVSISPETIWGWFQQARDAGISLQQVLRVISDDPEAGCAGSRAEYWCWKYQDMYVQRRAKSFEAVHHLNICADPLLDSNRETCLAVIYSCERDVAAYGGVQLMPQGKAVCRLKRLCRNLLLRP